MSSKEHMLSKLTPLLAHINETIEKRGKKKFYVHSHLYIYNEDTLCIDVEFFKNSNMCGDFTSGVYGTTITECLNNIKYNYLCAVNKLERKISSYKNLALYIRANLRNIIDDAFADALHTVSSVRHCEHCGSTDMTNTVVGGVSNKVVCNTCNYTKYTPVTNQKQVTNPYGSISTDPQVVTAVKEDEQYYTCSECGYPKAYKFGRHGDTTITSCPKCGQTGYLNKTPKGEKIKLNDGLGEIEIDTEEVWKRHKGML